MYTLKLRPTLKDALWAHLLPTDCVREQAAFLFCAPSSLGDRTEFDVVDSSFLTAKDFAAQHEDYLELSDKVRIAIIKRAHTLGTSLVEMHSHPSPWMAAFSPADRRGLRDTVPHMRWRLKGRPYIAIVVAPSGFDALVWWHDAVAPEPLGGIQVGDLLMEPTNASLEGWNDASW